MECARGHGTPIKIPHNAEAENAQNVGEDGHERRRDQKQKHAGKPTSFADIGHQRAQSQQGDHRAEPAAHLAHQKEIVSKMHVRSFANHGKREQIRELNRGFRGDQLEPQREALRDRRRDGYHEKQKRDGEPDRAGTVHAVRKQQYARYHRKQ